MNRGRKIYTRMLESADRMAAIRALGNTDIYALVRHIFRQELEATDTGSLICGMAHVTVMERFLVREAKDDKTQDFKTQDAREEAREDVREEARVEQAARDCAGAMGEGYLP